MIMPRSIVIILSLIHFPFAYAFTLPWTRSNIHYETALHPNPLNGHWIDTWTSTPQLTESSNLPPPPFNTTNLLFPNTTLRQTFHITTPASQLRLRLSNAFSDAVLPITKASIALPLAAADGNGNLTGSRLINTTTLRHLTFSGEAGITISPGALAVSDPVEFKVGPGQVVAISLYLRDGQGTQSITSHPGSRTSSWISFGDGTEAGDLMGPSTLEVFHWYYISALEAWSSPEVSSFVVVGDSITDGRSSWNNANGRWTDHLFNRLQFLSSSTPALGNIAISNQGAGGNRVLADGSGPSAVSRVERDVIAHPGVKYAMVLEGVNDIGMANATVEEQRMVGDALIQAYKQMIARIHTAGIVAFGGTITPFGCGNTTVQPYSDAARETTRLRVNEWIRQSVGVRGGFDAVVDYDEVVRNPANHTELNPALSSGDCLHPSPEGYRVMANAFPVELFERFDNRVSTFI